MRHTRFPRRFQVTLGLPRDRIGFGSLSSTTNPTIHVKSLIQRAPLFVSEPSEFEKLYYRYRAQKDLLNSGPYLERLYQKVSGYESTGLIDRDELLRADLSKEITQGWRSRPEDKNASVSEIHRKPQRTLYMLVKNTPDSAWELPSSPLLDNEPLHMAAKRLNNDILSLMTCIIGKVPFAHINSPDGSSKMFIMKSRVVEETEPGSKEKIVSKVSNFAFLCKEEIKEYVDTQYYSHIKNILVDI